MPVRKTPLENGEFYHIYSKSIADFEIFRINSEYERIKGLIKYYVKKNPPLRFSFFLEIKNSEKLYQKQIVTLENLVDIIAYCFMPTHVHLILKQVKRNGISIFMRCILDSYARYFNIKSKRKGPLWESRFKSVIIETDEQLLHLTRYIHLNPVTAYLVNKPEDWAYSSYKEYIGQMQDREKICNHSEVLAILPTAEEYSKFVNSQVDYQRELAESKRIEA